MTDLLIHVPIPPDPDTGTVFGGRPVMPRGTPFNWPVCKACKGQMQFLGRLAVPADEFGEARFALLFMCNNDPGLCDEWDPDEGANFVFIVPSKDADTTPNSPAATAIRKTTYGATLLSLPIADYDAALKAWANDNKKPAREVLGQLFGEPTWVQSEHRPACDKCGKTMRFIAQVEEGPDMNDQMNFGGGCAYVFECNCGSNIGKFLWQCG